MDLEQSKLFIKQFFEKYYDKLSKEYEGALKLPGVPKEMWADDVKPDEEWKTWKLIPAVVSDEDIAAQEDDLGVQFPNVLKCFLTTYFHFFKAPVGRHSSDKPFYAINNAWNPVLVKAGYLPFTWDEEGYFIRCIDLANMPDEDKCPVCQIDHEILFDFDEDAAVSRAEIEAEMEVLADNFTAYLEGLLD